MKPNKSATKRTVHVGGRLKAQGRAAGPSAGGETSGVAAPNKVPLSESVLRAVGLHGGTGADGTPIDMRDTADAVHVAQPARADVKTDADKILWLSHEYGGFFERTPNGDGSVTVRFVYGDGDACAAKGATTKEAIAALCTKLGEDF